MATFSVTARASEASPSAESLDHLWWPLAGCVIVAVSVVAELERMKSAQVVEPQFVGRFDKEVDVSQP